MSIEYEGSYHGWERLYERYGGPKTLQQDEAGIWDCTVGGNVEGTGVHCGGRGKTKADAIKLAFVRMESQISMRQRARLASCHGTRID